MFLAKSIIFTIRILRRIQMYLLAPAFHRHGRNFIFSPGDRFTYHTIETGDDVSIGPGATFIASESRIMIGSKVLFGPNVTIMGGNHNTSVAGQFMYDVRDKRPEDDQDVVIEDDVWVGAGVIILKGVHVGRGSIIAAGAVVNRDIPPYTVAAGIPARPIRVRFDVETIMCHEKLLYPPEKRLPVDLLLASQKNIKH